MARLVAIRELTHTHTYAYRGQSELRHSQYVTRCALMPQGAVKERRSFTPVHEFSQAAFDAFAYMTPLSVAEGTWGGEECATVLGTRFLVGPVYRLLYRGTYTGHGVSQQIFVFAWVLHPSSGTVSSSFSGLPLIITSFVAISATTNVTRVLNNKTHSTTWAGASVWSIKQQNT